MEKGGTTTTARFIMESKTEISLIADNAAPGIYGRGTLKRQTLHHNEIPGKPALAGGASRTPR